METRANYVLAGGFVLLVVAGLVGFVLWLGKAQFDRDFTHYRILFQGSVTGLKEANPVRYRGVPVGSVTSIRINPKNVEQVEVIIQVTRNTPIKQDTVASLEFQGITGVAYVQLSGGTQASPPLTPPADRRLPVIASKPSQLEKVIKDAPQLIQQFIVLVDRASQLLGDANQKSIAGTLDNLEVITAALAGRAPQVESILDDAAGAMAELRQTATSAKVLVAGLDARANRISGQAEAAVADLRLAAASVRKLTSGLEPHVDRISNDAEAAVADLRLASASVKELTGGLAPRVDRISSDAEAAVADLRLASASVKELTGGLAPRVDRISGDAEAAVADLRLASASVKEVTSGLKPRVEKISTDAVAAMAELRLAAGSVKELTGGLAPRVARISSDAEAAVADLRLASASVKEVTGGLEPRVARISTDAAAAMSELRLAAGSVKELAGGLEARLDDMSGDAAATMSELRLAASSVKELAGDIEARVAAVSENVNTTLATTNTSAAAVGDSVVRLEGELRPMIAEVGRAAEGISRAARQLEGLVAENRRPIRDFSNAGLYDLSELLTEIRTMVGSLTRLTEKMESDPARFLFGDSLQSGFEPK